VVLVSGVAEQFRDAVLARDMEAAEALLSEDVVFREVIPQTMEEMGLSP
jgi:hypothetical protein